MKLAPLLLAVGACATLAPPAQSTGPARSDKGIQLAVVRQGCSQTQEPDQYGWDLVEENVEIEVRNASPEPATVHREQFRLLGPDGSALRTLTWRAADPLMVAGGQVQTFELRYMTHGGLACTGEMRLDPGSGITLRESAVALRPVSFIPTRGL